MEGRRVVSCRVVSCRAVPCRAVPCRVVSCRVVSWSHSMLWLRPEFSAMSSCCFSEFVTVEPRPFLPLDPSTVAAHVMQSVRSSLCSRHVLYLRILRHSVLLAVGFQRLLSVAHPEVGFLQDESFRVPCCSTQL
jgi:hypothetical protein